MSSTVEPSHVGPIAGGNLRASDADRERVAEVLRDALAEGRLDMAEFEERLEATYSARTYGDLEPITRDLGCFAISALTASHRIPSQVSNAEQGRSRYARCVFSMCV